MHGPYVRIPVHVPQFFFGGQRVRFVDSDAGSREIPENRTQFV